MGVTIWNVHARCDFVYSAKQHVGLLRDVYIGSISRFAANSLCSCLLELNETVTI